MNNNSPSGIHWEVLNGLPLDEEIIQYPRNPVDYSKDFLIRVTPEKGDGWVGNFHGIDTHYFSGVLPWPKQNYLCVIARGLAYIVSVDQPDVYEELSFIPITDAHVVPDPDMVIFTSFTDIAAYQDNGQAWRIEDLAKDGIEIEGIGDGQIYGRIDIINKLLSFRLDLYTGKPIIGI